MNPCEPPSGALVAPARNLWPLGVLLGGLLSLSFVSGCSTPGMKGTPFYTGDYSKRQGPAEQRVNVWPLLYYREPALSVVWPVFELTDDHAAVRPLFSVYGLDQTNHQYNVLWPLAQFDQRTGDNFIFPLFWGDEHRVLFPLYWHLGEPWGQAGGSDTLFPLWHLSRKGDERFNLYSPWPLVRVWADEKKHVNGSMVIPLYYYRSGLDASQFFSLFWFSETKANGDYWRLLFPLCYGMESQDAAALVTPLWAQGHCGANHWRGMLPFWMYSSDDAGRYDLSAPWPLVRFWSDPGTGGRGSRVLPLYWHEREEGATRFFSLPWSSGGDAAGFWRCVPPLFYQSSNELRTTLLTPLYSQGRVDRTDWKLLLPLWYSSHEATNRFKLYSPLAYFWADRRADEQGSIVFPLYWHQNKRGSSQFNSLLWMNHSEPNGDHWRLLPPLCYQESNRTGTRLITPLWAQGKTETNDWAAVIPLCYWDRQQNTWLSALWAHWRYGEHETWLAPWTLSWLTQSPGRSDLNLLGGVARASWGPNPAADYVFPLYYHDSQAGKLLSPVWLQWQKEDTQTAIAPWLLSWRTRQPDRTDFWFAGGFACASWGEKPGADYVLPLFYHDSERLLTPLFGWDKEHDLRYYATPLAGLRTGDRSGSWLFPLYSHSRVKATEEVRDNFLLLGNYRKNRSSSRSWFIPFYYYQNRFAPESLAGESGRHRCFGKKFWCFPICWYRNDFYLRPERTHAVAAKDVALPAEPNSELPAANVVADATTTTNVTLIRDETRKHGVFPLWSYSSRTTPAEGRGKQKSSVLLWLYDHQHEFGPRPGSPTVANDYTRSRVLWRLWHYENLNGDVSVDVFPSFTYDRKPDGFKKVSFLWRFFRYERSATGETKLDALFVPLKR